MAETESYYARFLRLHRETTRERYEHRRRVDHIVNNRYQMGMVDRDLTQWETEMWADGDPVWNTEWWDD